MTSDLPEIVPGHIGLGFSGQHLIISLLLEALVLVASLTHCGWAQGGCCELPQECACSLSRVLAHWPLFFSFIPFPLARGIPVWSLLQSLVAMLLVSAYSWWLTGTGERTPLLQTDRYQSHSCSDSRSGHLLRLCHQDRSSCTGPALSPRFGHSSCPCQLPRAILPALLEGRRWVKPWGCLLQPALVERWPDTATTSRRHWVPKAQGGNLSPVLQADGPSLRGVDPFSIQVTK